MHLILHKATNYLQDKSPIWNFHNDGRICFYYSFYMLHYLNNQ